ncbi:NACHT domain-containing protein [Kosakonia sacchari]|uniref:NACHT domain-containing protein n=1 Tax=Kosakonia sacchari TaxID=1158459 RepID=UPI002ACEB0DA|nr:NACHT domain-containing protein [Kosakonia sacchari]MDZ7324483.1 NACHT domain-containing protein [Kosakonia sacchari]
MSGSQKFVLLLLVLALCFVVGTGLYSSWFNAASVGVFICLMLYFTRPLLMPAGYGANKIRTLVLVLGLGIIGSGSSALNTLLPTIWSLPVLQNAPAWLKNIQFISQPSPWILTAVVIIVGIVFFCLRDKSVGGGHPTPLKEDFPEESFPRKLEAFCNVLRRDLTTVDQDTNWSPEYYTELQAEVEIRKTKGSAARKKIMGLQDAIRKDRKSQSFLVLGVPGSGKSVALRKLAKDMLDEVKKTNRVPIYVNLREWVPISTIIGGRTEFSVEDLESFVIKNLIRRGDVFTKDFVDAYFRKLWRSGRLFFIFDSFDEISELLDANEDSDVINSLSDVISRFIASHPASRGVLSSRVFRQPTRAFLAEKVLEIRPLSEAGISEALSRYPQFTGQVRSELFSHRQDLMPLARNPFIMALLGEWIAVNEQLPANQAEIYKNYIGRRLALCRTRLDKVGITIQEVVDVSIEIAWFVFHSPTYGLEAPVKVISDHFKSDKVDAVLEVLSYARIARVTTGDEKSFAFVHRRFLEYFVTTRFLQTPEVVPDDHIPTDSRGRDALVLYAQLCSENEAQRLANLCWREIQQHFANSHTRIRAIHCLRFLIDAFGSRRDVILPFEAALSDFVMEHVKTGDSIILAKICLEATGILSESRAAPILAVAIVGPDGWLRETAFRACRHLPKMEAGLEEGIKKYVLGIPDVHFWGSRKNILLSLSLSDALSGVYRVARLRLWNMKVSMICSALLTVVMPFIVAFGAAYAAAGSASLFFVLKTGKKEKPENNQGEKPIRRPLTSLVEPGFFACTVVMFRVLCCLILALMSIIGLFSAEMVHVITPFAAYGEFSGAYHWWVAVLVVVSGLLLLDWVSISRFVRSKIKDLFNLRKWLSNLSILAVSALMVWGMFLWIDYVTKRPLATKVFVSIILLTCAGFAVVAAVRVIVALKDCFHDWRLLRSITLFTTPTRAEIARVFSTCLSNYGRLQYVHKLEGAGISPSGEWPAEFKLAVGLGEAYTALARLEERWLNLDR